MAKCKIVEPCIYLQGGKAIHHTVPGAVVELDDSTIVALGGAVECLDYTEDDALADIERRQRDEGVEADAPATRKSRRKSEPEGNDDK